MKIKAAVTLVTTGAIAIAANANATLVMGGAASAANTVTVAFPAFGVQTNAERAAAMAAAINANTAKNSAGYRPVATAVNDLLIIAAVLPDAATDVASITAYGSAEVAANFATSNFVVKDIDPTYTGPEMPVGAKTAIEYRDGLIAAAFAGGTVGLMAPRAK